MITLVRKFSISVKDYGEKVLPVLYILEDKVVTASLLSNQTLSHLELVVG